MTDVVVTEKETAVFHCTTSKINAPLKWCYENSEVSKTEKFKVEVDGKEHKLTVYNCHFNDEGRYKAVIGARQTSGSLTVKGIGY